MQKVHPGLPAEALIGIGGKLQLEAQVTLITLLVLVPVTGRWAVRREKGIAIR